MTKALFSFLLLVFAFSPLAVRGQNFEILLDSQSYFYRLIALSDGNFAAVGSKSTDLANPKSWLYKLSPSGQLLQEKSYSPTGGSSMATGITEASDHGFFITGNSGESFNSSGFLLKTTPQLNLGWVKELGNSIWTAVQLPDGKILAGGQNGDKAVVWKLTATGNVISQQELVFPFNGMVQKILLNPDGSYYAVGRGEVTGVGFQGFFVTLFNPDGSQAWANSYNVDNYYQELISYNMIGPIGAVRAPNGDVVITDGGDATFGVFRYSNSGQKIWENSYSMPNKLMIPFDLKMDPAGDLYIVGKYRASSFFNSFMTKISAGGMQEWIRLYEGPGTNMLTSMEPLPDGRLLSTGFRLWDYSHCQAYLGLSDNKGYFFNHSLRAQVLYDQNDNCMIDPADTPLEGWSVDFNAGGEEKALFTDSNGAVQLPLAEGSYSVNVIPPSALWETCAPAPQVFIDAGSPALVETTVLVKKKTACPVLNIALTTPDLLRCQTSIFYIECQNLGTETAQNAQVSLHLDPLLSFQTASQTYVENAGEYVFDLGNLEPLAKKRFWVKARLDCSATIGQTHCIEAKALPVSPCSVFPPAGPDWSGASVLARVRCEGNESLFSLENIGTGDMTEPSTYRIVADGALEESGSFQLAAGQKTDIAFANEGRSVYLEAYQVKDHPGRNRPMAALEGCGTTNSGFPSTGYASMFPQNERASGISVACVENTAYLMPARVVSIPEGYGRYHFLHPGSSPEYCLKFKNTLNQTAQKVQIHLILPDIGKVSDFHLSASNLDFTVQSEGDRALTLTADNAQLPPASVDSLAGWGYLRFDMGDLPEGVGTAYLVVGAQVYLDGTASASAWPAYYNVDSIQLRLATDPSPVSTNQGMKIFGGSGFEWGNAVVETPDGSMFLLNTSLSYGNWYDLLLVKTDGTGRGIWQKVYDFHGGGDVFWNAVSDGAGGLVATGYQDDPEVPDNYLKDAYITLVRIDGDGKVLWYKRIKPGVEGDGGDPSKVIRSSDGSFVVTGYLINGQGSSDNFLWKVSPDGETVWFQNYIINGVAFKPVNLYETPDGGYAMGGFDDGSGGGAAFYFQKTDAAGETEWVKTLDQVSSYSEVSNFAPTPDGGWMLLDNDYVYDADSNYHTYPVLTKVNADIEIQWSKMIETGYFSWPYQIIPSSNGGFLIGGEGIPDTNANYRTMALWEADQDGNLQWLRWYDAHTTTSPHGIILRNDNRYAIAAETQATNWVYNLQGVLLTLQADGAVATKPSPSLAADNPLMLFPNPVFRKFTVAAPAGCQGPLRWQLFDLQGKLVSEGDAARFPFTAEAPRSAGFYQLKVDWKGASATIPVVARGW